MDSRTVINNQSFGVRATGLLVRDNQLYLVKSPEGKYYTLGGAVQVGPLAFVVENQFELDGNSYHQIEFQYLLTPLAEPAGQLEEGSSVRRCEWVAFSDLVKLDLNPSFLKTALAVWDGQLQHYMNTDKERN